MRTKSVRGPLTLRGVTFLLVGIAGAVVPIVQAGTGGLVRVAILALSLPLVCAVVVHLTENNIRCRRSIEPTRVQVGEETRVTLQLENTSGLRSGRLLAHDVLPRRISVAQPRFVIERLDGHATREIRYVLRPAVRGRYQVGPLTVRVGDPFGMSEIARAFPAVETLIVIPVVEHLPQVLLGGEWTGGDDSSPSAIRTAGEDDIGIREYHRGDPLHRINWRATARRGELMVRQEEQPRQSRATLLLDARWSAHRGEGATSSLEWAVSAVASLAIHLHRRGFSLRVLTETGDPLVGTAADLLAPVPDVEGLLLDGLAELESSRVPSLRDASLALGRAGSDSLMIAVLGTMSEQDASDLARRRQGTSTAVAIVQRAWTWAGPGSEPAAEREYTRSVALLRDAGWRVVQVRAGDRLADLWPLAARGAAGTGIPLVEAGA
ncbi:MAG TPA: DUF58 domain-containing protein [Sporichthyaceae bacterium]|nr:DUF58 domain-containing protein [Sporichthyaceae bacterium]